MKKLTGKLEDLFIDITFAEDREFDSIRLALNNVEEKLEDTFTAITFAEAAEVETAAGCINKGGQTPKYGRLSSSARRFHKLCSGRA